MNSESNQRLILTMTLYFIASEYVLTVIIAVLNMQADKYLKRHINLCVIASFILTFTILLTIMIQYAMLFGGHYYGSIDIISFANN